MRLSLQDVYLPLRHPFTTSHGTTTVRHNLIVSLSQDGLTGYGEGATSFAHGAFTAQAMRADLEAARDTIETARLSDPTTLWDQLIPVLGHNRFALCAVDQAAHDLWGKLHQKPVWELWGLTLDHLPVSSYTIGIDSLPAMVAKMHEFDGWPTYKIKLGTPDDLAIVRGLRQHSGAAFRIDANTAWSAGYTLTAAPELASLGVEFLEQPLARDDWDGMATLKARCPLPVIADESCLVEEDVERCASCFDGINIKLTKAGGLTPARRMAERARELGIQVMAGCMVESSVGISAIAQLLPLLDHVDLDGSTLITSDIATGVELDHGTAVFPQRHGTGAELIPGALEALASPPPH